MNKKRFTSIFTACLLLISFTWMLKGNSEVQAEESYLTDVIMEKQSQLIKITFTEYAIGASSSNQVALNDYIVKYLVTDNNKTYSFMDYAIYSIGQDSVSEIILQLDKDKANVEKNVENVKQGGFINGKLDNLEDADEDFIVEEIE